VAPTRLLCEPVVRQRERDVAGDALRDRQIILREPCLLMRQEIHSSAQATSEADRYAQRRLQTRRSRRTVLSKRMSCHVIDDEGLPQELENLWLDNHGLVHALRAVR